MNEQIYTIDNVESFELRDIFECGQCFRWNLDKQDNSYTGIVGKNVLNIKKEQNKIIVKGYCTDNIKEICNNYFDLTTNYEKIKKQLSSIDNNMKLSVNYGKGIRILHQDVWETLISFIISANNNIPRIKGIIEKLSKNYGQEIEWNNKKYYSFPTASELSVATVEDLRKLGLGFRDERVFKTTKMIMDKQVDITKLEEMEDINELREELLKLPGVGPKVADCIMLFSMKKYEVFPIDVWVKRVMTELYTNEIVKIKDVNTKLHSNNTINNKQILELASNKYGKLAGLAQQYLFYWRREQEN